MNSIILSVVSTVPVGLYDINSVERRTTFNAAHEKAKREGFKIIFV